MNNILNLNKYVNAPNIKNWTQSDKNHIDPKDTRITSFSREELNHILALYGRKVVSGQWKDYAIDTLKDQAIFSIFKKLKTHQSIILVENSHLIFHNFENPLNNVNLH